MLPPFNPKWALFLDVDGTLVDFVEDPSDVRAAPALRDLLKELHASSGGALALVSGRPVESVDAIFDPLRLPVAGQHGHERRDGSGRLVRSEVDVEALAALRRRFEDFVRARPGTFIEDKGAAFALHYRRSPSVEPEAKKLAAEIEPELPKSFGLQPGKMVLEVRPAGCTKATAIAEFMNENPFRGRKPSFLGDDVTDEDGFRWINANGGISVKVGRRETEARFRLADVRAVSEWLSEYAAYLAKNG